MLNFNFLVSVPKEVKDPELIYDEFMEWIHEHVKQNPELEKLDEEDWEEYFQNCWQSFLEKYLA
jgi:NADH:ubiquinone oxidoreductase subunit